MKYEHFFMKKMVFSPLRTMGMKKLEVFRMKNYGFSLYEYILEDGMWELCSRYNSTHIEDIQNEINYTKRN